MPSTLDLLDVPHVFEQRAILLIDTADGFLAQCKRRGLDLERGQLDALHRAGLLPPMYRVTRDIDAIRAWLNVHPSDHPLEAPAAQVLGDLTSDCAAGRIIDAQAEYYVPWYRYREIMGFTLPDAFGAKRPIIISSSVFLYSHYQLLLLPGLEQVVARMKRRRIGRDWHFTVAKRDCYRQDLVRRVASNSKLTVVLTVLESCYLPEIIGTLRGWLSFADWLEYRRSFDPRATLTWLGWTAAQVKDAAIELLVRAHDIDSTGDYHELIRLSSPEQWQTLRRDALMALDHRIAAELLLRCYDDLVQSGSAPALEAIPRYDWHPIRERLGADGLQLDSALTEFGLSPHPAVVLVLEGETEYNIMVPRVMDVLGVRPSRTTIHLENMQSVERDLSMLVSYVVTPMLGEQRGDAVLLVNRPLTRFIVAVDPEGPYQTARGCEEQRRRWVNRLCHGLPSDTPPAIRQQIDQLVHIETWGQASFEYAHFSDEEIAQAIQGLNSQWRPGTTLAHVTPVKIGQLRAERRNLDAFVKDAGFSKIQLAQELWPVLEARLIAAQANSTLDTIPIARVVRKVWDLAHMAWRQRAIDLR